MGEVFSHFLQDRVAVVTGSSGGIGREFARALAGVGAHVVVADIADGSGTVDAIISEGGRAVYIPVDVSDEESVKNMVRRSSSQFGNVDVLVNNAALYGNITPKSIEQLTVADWEKVLKVNVIGHFLCARECIPGMKQKGWGRIINVASAAQYTVPINLAHYVASKSAINGLTRVMAREMGSYGITVNTVSPGLVQTEATNKLTAPDYVQNTVERRCIKRTLDAPDIVGMVVFLASPASAAITGQHFIVDGGYIFR